MENENLIPIDNTPFESAKDAARVQNLPRHGESFREDVWLRVQEAMPYNVGYFIDPVTRKYVKVGEESVESVTQPKFYRRILNKIVAQFN